MMYEIAGPAAFEPFDEGLCEAVEELVVSTCNATDKLSPRARHARFNLIWKDFLAEQKALRAVPEINLCDMCARPIPEKISCPLVGCKIIGPHEHGTGGPTENLSAALPSVVDMAIPGALRLP